MLPFGQVGVTQPASPSATLPVVATAQPTLQPSEEPPLQPVTLVLWVPPEFDPAAGTPAGDLLADRLQSFLSLHPDLRIEVRLKALEGAGGLLDSLTTASAAAPLALPDLVALPRPLMEAAALKGFLRPFDDLTQVQLAEDWYPYANELARLQSSTFGLPFAGDALLLAYSPGSDTSLPLTWNETIQITGTLAFPASDPEALFPLSLYLAAGGKILDEQGRPDLDAEILTGILDFLLRAEQNASLPYWIMQQETVNESWEAFTQGQVDQTLSWSSRFFLQDAVPYREMQVMLLPAPAEKRFTLITGWVWALPVTQPNRQSLSAQLAEYLVDSIFLAQWTEAAGYIPTRSLALASWSQPEARTLVELIVTSARPSPPADVLLALGPALKQATLNVLTHQQTPQQAAEEAATALSGK